MKKEKLVWCATIILSIIYIVTAGITAHRGKTVYYQERDTHRVLKAKVDQVIDADYGKTLYNGLDTEDKVILFEAIITRGLQKGAKIRVIQYIDMMYGDMPTVSTGDKIIVYRDDNSSALGAQYIFSSFDRTGYLLALAILFCALILVLGKKKGLNTLVSLVFTLCTVFGVFIPATLNGQNIYLWAVSSNIFIILMTVVLVNGASDKSLCAIAGCCGGVLTAGLITLSGNSLLHLTGLAGEESMYLVFINPYTPINLKAVVFASIIFGAVGAIMDVSMSMASALKELSIQAPDITSKQLFKSGIAIGQDMMGTMANTLILAYIGSSLGATLLTMAYNSVGTQLLNSELMVTQLLQALAGSIGMFLSIPLTAYISSVIYPKNKV